MKVFLIATWKVRNRYHAAGLETLWMEHSEHWCNRYVAQLYDFSTANIERIITKIVNAEAMLHGFETRFQRVTVAELYDGWQLQLDSTLEVGAAPESFGFYRDRAFETWTGENFSTWYNSEVIARAGFNRVSGRVAANAYRGCVPLGSFELDEKEQMQTVPSNDFWAVKMPAFCAAMNDIPEIASDVRLDLLGRFEPAPLAIREWIGHGVSTLNAMAKQRDYSRPPRYWFLVALHESAAEATLRFNYCWQKERDAKSFPWPISLNSYWTKVMALVRDQSQHFIDLASFARFAGEVLEPYDKTVLHSDAVMTAKYGKFIKGTCGIALDYDAVSPALQRLATLYDFLSFAKVFQLWPWQDTVTYQSFLMAQLQAFREVMRTLALLELIIPNRLYTQGKLPAGTVPVHPKKDIFEARFPNWEGVYSGSGLNAYITLSHREEDFRLLTMPIGLSYQKRPRPRDRRDPGPVRLYWPGPAVDDNGNPATDDDYRPPEPPGSPPERPGRAPEPTGGIPERPGSGPFQREPGGNWWDVDPVEIFKTITPEWIGFMKDTLNQPPDPGMGEGGRVRINEPVKPIIREVPKGEPALPEISEAAKELRAAIKFARDNPEVFRYIKLFRP